MNEYRQSTSQVVRFGPLLEIDGITPATALTITQSDMQISKDGAAFAQKNSAGNATHDTDGFYSTTYDSTDTDTTASIKIQVNVAGALPFFMTANVVTQTFYDAKYAGTFNNFDSLSDTVSNVTLVATTTANTDMRGTDGANIVAPPSVAQLNARTILSAEYATSANLSTVDTVVDAIKVMTDQLTFTVSNELDVNMLTHTAVIPTNYITSTGITAGALDDKGNWNIGKTGYSLTQSFPANFADISITATTGLLDLTQTAADKSWSTATRVLTAGTNLNDISASQVNTEVLDVLTVATFSEVAYPGDTASILDKINYTYSMSSNKLTQTSSTQVLRNSGDTFDLGTAAVSDDGTTFTRGKHT